MMRFADLIDTLALGLVHDPRSVIAARPDDAAIAVGTGVSRSALRNRHTKLSGRVMAELLDTSHLNDERVLTGRQLHALIAIGAADLLERDQLAAFLASYVDPGVPVWYQAVSVTALHDALHAVFARYEPAKRTRLLTSLARHTEMELLRWAPEGTKFAPAFLETYATSPDRLVRAAVARNASTPADALHQLSTDRDDTIRAAVAGNPNTAADDLDRLAADDFWEARIAVAANPSAGPTTLATLAQHRTPSVRKRVGRNPSTPPEILDFLAHDAEREVRVAVAANPSTEATTLLHFTEFQPVQVRIGAASHPNADEAVLMRLCADDDARVRSAVAANPNTTTAILSAMAGDTQLDVRVAVAANPNADMATLAQLGRDRSWNIRLLVAENPQAPVETLRVLVSDQSANVRIAVARHERTPSDTLAELATDIDRGVREAVASHAAVEANVLNKLANDEHPEVRIAVAQHERTLPTTLERLAVDAIAAVRDAVDEHPATTPEIRRLLAQPQRQRRRRTGETRAPRPRALPSRRATLPRLAGSAARRRQQLAGAAADEPDPHARYALALQRGAVPRRAIPAPAIARLAIAVTAVRAGAWPASSDVRDVTTLPTLDDVPFPTAAAAQACFADTSVPVTVLTNGREQRRNGAVMDNCTLTDSYIASCERGNTIVAAFTYEDRVYNIAWRSFPSSATSPSPRTSAFASSWTMIDLKGAHNTPPPAAVRSIGEELTTHLEGLTPFTPLGITSAAALSELTIDPTPAPTNTRSGMTRP